MERNHTVTSVLIIGRGVYPFSRHGGAEISIMLQARKLNEKGLRPVILCFSEFENKIIQRMSEGIPIFIIPLNVNRNKRISEIIFNSGKIYANKLNENKKLIQNIIEKYRVELVHAQQDTVLGIDALSIPVIWTPRELSVLYPCGPVLKSCLTCGKCSFKDALQCNVGRSLNYFDQSLIRGFGKSIDVMRLSRIIISPLEGAVNKAASFDNQSHVIKTVDYATAISKYMYQLLIAAGIESNNVKLIYNLMPDFPYISPTKNEVLTLGFMGSPNYIKGFLHLLLGFHCALKQNKQLRLVIIGNVHMEYVEIIRKLGLDKYVCIKGQVEHDKIPFIIKDVDVIVVPSIWPEPFGRVAAEAMLAGKPVLATHIGGLIDIVDEGDNGFFLYSTDPDSIGKKINEIAALPKQQLINLGLNGRSSVLKKFSNDVEIQKTIRLYEIACNNAAKV